MLQPFRNEPPSDFTRPAEREAFLAALAQVEAGFDRDYPLIVGGEALWSG